MKSLCLVVLILAETSISYGNPPPIEEQWAACSLDYEKYSWPLKDKLTKLLKNVSSDTSIKLGSECRKGLKNWSDGITDRSLWAYQIMDSIAKMRPGIFTNRYVDFGNYQQCLDVVHDEEKIIGQYSLIQIVWNQSEMVLKEYEGEPATAYNFENFVSAICYPSTCTKYDVEAFLDHFNTKLDINIKLLTMETNESSSIDYSVQKIMAAIILVSLFGMSHLSTTLCYYFGAEKMPTVVKVFDCGSAWEKLTSDSSSDVGKRLDFFNGIKVLYLVATICVHLYLPIRPLLSAMYLPGIQYFDENPITAAIAKISMASAAVNFVIGGAISYYTWFNILLVKQGKCSYLTYFMSRYLKTLPSIVAGILLVIAFPPLLGGGPLSRNNLNQVTENCIKNFWAEIFGVSNHIEQRNMCLPHAWHLSIELQLYTASFFLILFLFKEPVKGVLLTLSIALGSIAYKMFQIHYHGQPAFITFEQGIQTIVGNISEALFSLNNNIPSYMIGILLGHFMVKDLIIRPKFSPLGWILLAQATCLVFLTSTVALALPFVLPSNLQALLDNKFLTFLSTSMTSEAIYSLKLWIGSTFQSAVSLVFALFCYLCYNESRSVPEEAGKLSLFNHVSKLLVSLLSCKFFVVLGRISLPMTITHYLVIEYMVSVMTDPFPIDFGEVLLRAPFVLFMSTFIGLVIHVTIESPFKKLLAYVTKENTQIVDVINNEHKIQKIE